MNEPIGTVACVNLEGTHRYIREMVAETMTPRQSDECRRS